MSVAYLDPKHADRNSRDRPPSKPVKARELQEARERRDRIAHQLQELLHKRPYRGLAGVIRRSEKVAALVAERRALDAQLLCLEFELR